MDKILEYIDKIIKKAGDKQAYHVFSVEHRSTFQKPFYQVVIVWSKKDVPALKFAQYTKVQLLVDLKRYFRTQKENEVSIKYHEAQIEGNKQVMEYHKKAIDGYKKPVKEKKADKK